MKTTLIRKSANAKMHFKMTFKVTLHVLLGIAVLFIAIIPARIVSCIFSHDTTIFIVSLIGFCGLLEYVVWCFLDAPSRIYDSFQSSKADGLLQDSPIVDVPIKPTLANTEMDSQESIEKIVEEAEVNKTENNHLALYKKGCDDYYHNVAAQKKEQLDIIAAYLHYIMAPFTMWLHKRRNNLTSSPPICTTSWLLSSSRRKWTAFVKRSCLLQSIPIIRLSRGRVSKAR